MWKPATDVPGIFKPMIRPHYAWIPTWKRLFFPLSIRRSYTAPFEPNYRACMELTSLHELSSV